MTQVVKQEPKESTKILLGPKSPHLSEDSLDKTTPSFLRSVASGEAGSDQWTNSQTPITPLMQEEDFYSIVKPNKGRLFGVAHMDYDEPTDSPAIILPRQAWYKRDFINLTEVVKVISQQVSALCQERGVTVPLVPRAEQPLVRSTNPPIQTSPTEATTMDATFDLSHSTNPSTNEHVNLENMENTTFTDDFFVTMQNQRV